MMVPFVVDLHGQRFAKYPPGWPVVLAFGILVGIRSWINPLLAGVCLWLTFRLGQKLLNAWTGLLAALLTLSSPLFLINSGSLDAHPWSLFLSLAFALAWLDTFSARQGPDPAPSRQIPESITIPIAGLCLGLLVLSRPLTAVGVGLPFFILGLVKLVRGSRQERLRVVGIGALALAIGSLFLAWQFAVTGNPLLDPYTLWWNFDRLGFGPGIGTYAGGYTPLQALRNAGIMLTETARDLFGWGSLSWLFLPFGFWAIRRNRVLFPVAAVFFSLVISYLFYWAWVGHYGPRYYFEGMYSLTLVSAVGIFWLAGWTGSRFGKKPRLVLTSLLLTTLIGYNLSSYLPQRLHSVYGTYNVHASQLAPFQTAQARALTPAIVFVHVQKIWTEYGGLLDLENPWLTSPFIFAWSINPAVDQATASAYPGRRSVYYYPDEPDRLYLTPR
jgi:4-amino-4-deoxy-L-arabinose transferase-like glycosyltransferase